MAYNAWITSSKSALKDLKKEKKILKREEEKRAKRELQKQQGETLLWFEPWSSVFVFFEKCSSSDFLIHLNNWM